MNNNTQFLSRRHVLGGYWCSRAEFQESVRAAIALREALFHSGELSPNDDGELVSTAIRRRAGYGEGQLPN